MLGKVFDNATLYKYLMYSPSYYLTVACESTGDEKICAERMMCGTRQTTAWKEIKSYKAEE